MLKIEKEGSKKEIKIRLRKKPSLFSPLFLQAIFFAFLFHLLFFTFFRISSFKTESLFHFPAIPVEANDVNGKFYVDATLNKSIHKPLLDELQNNPLEEYLSIKKIFQEKENDREIPKEAFEEIANEILVLNWPLKSKTQIEWPLIELGIDGDLKLESPFKPPVALSPPQGDVMSLSFSFRVDNATGQIVWHQLKQSSGSQEMDEKMEKQLLALKFHQKNGLLIFTQAIIHFKMYASTLISLQSYDQKGMQPERLCLATSLNLFAIAQQRNFVAA